MKRPERAAEADADRTKASENERVEQFSPLDPEVEAPINAAVHFDDGDFEPAVSDPNKDVEVKAPENARP
jgi:hypothetical protein